MKNCNFCIHEDKVYDLNGYEMLPDEDGVIAVYLNGMERRFKIDKMIAWLKESGYKSLFREPKIPKPIVVKEKLVKIPKPKKPQKVKVPRIKKPPKICKCGATMTGTTTCRKCYLEAHPKQYKQYYKKVEFDKRTIKGKPNDNGFVKRKIECSNGKKYNSLYEAGKDTGTTSSQIWHVCNGKWKHTHNLTFKYL